MKEQVITTIQEAASSKTALAVGVGTASVPAWIAFLNSENTQAIVILIGMIVSLTIICVNVQTFKARLVQNREKVRQEQLRTKLLEHEVRERGLS